MHPRPNPALPDLLPLVSRKDGCRLGRAGFERGCIRDTARIQRGFIGDRYALQSERVIFYPIIPDQAIRIGREWAGIGRASGVNVSLSRRDAILKLLSRAKYVQKSGPRCNKFVIRFMADLPQKYRGSVVNIVGLGSASPHHDHNWPAIFL